MIRDEGARGQERANREAGEELEEIPAVSESRGGISIGLDETPVGGAYGVAHRLRGGVDERRGPSSETIRSVVGVLPREAKPAERCASAGLRRLLRLRFDGLDELGDPGTVLFRAQVTPARQR